MIEPLQLVALLEKYASKDAGKVTSLKRAIRRGVTEGVLKPNDELPSTRRAAAALSMSRNSVMEAYEGLKAEGFIMTRRGARPRICEQPDLKSTAPVRQTPLVLSERGRILSAPPRNTPVQGRVEAFSPGLPDPSLFPRDDWATCLRRAARRDFRALDMYAQYSGLPQLREAIALHLKRVRGVSVAPDQVLVVPNTQSAIAMMAEFSADQGDIVMMEDPGYAGGRAVLEAKGLNVVGLPDRLEPRIKRTPPKLLYIMPSARYPTGSRMSLHRRVDVLAFAEAQGALVLEDDYDGDFVWHGTDVPPVFSLDTGASVVMLGTFSKSIMPGLRLAWLVVPQQYVSAVRQAHSALGLSVNTSLQAAAADFITSGQFSRHLRRAARAYECRLGVVVRVLQDILGDRVEVARPQGGLQVVVRLPQNADDVEITSRLWERGFEVAALSLLCIEKQERGLLIGIAKASERSTARLGEAISDILQNLA